MRYLRIFKALCMIFIVGSITGGYGWNRLVHAPYVAFVADRGYCGGRDVAGTAYLYPCRDAYIAQQLHTGDALSDATLADMAQKPQAKGKHR